MGNKIGCPVPGCEQESVSSGRLVYHMIHKHDMSPSQARNLLAGKKDPVETGATLNDPAPGKTEDPPEEKTATVAELEERLAKAESRTMDDFTPEEKANFVIGWGKGLSPEGKAVFARAVGIPMVLAPVEEAGEEGAIIDGKTDKPGYKYLEYLNLSVRE